MFQINGEPESPHEGARLGGVFKMYDEPISLGRQANVASDSVNAHSQCHTQLINEVILSIHSNGLFCAWKGRGSRVCGRTVQWCGHRGFEPCFRKPYFLHTPSAEHTVRMN